MDHDDWMTGRPLSRREVLVALGGASLGMLGPARLAHAQSGTACVVRPEQTEGPYFVDTGLARSDIRADAVTGAIEPGLPLQIEFRVARVERGDCGTLPNARVELWQCNAQGLYSGVRDPHGDTRQRTYLRGYQSTDARGIARFTTIYPGWYPGRAVHLHFSIQLGGGTRREAFTSQLYFDDALSDRVFRQAPYDTRGPQRVRNEADYIYRRSGGHRLLLDARRSNGGLAASFDVALQTERRHG